MTTERPGFVSWANARPVVSTPHQRVVIIGPDAYGGLDAVGSYAEIMVSTAPEYALVFYRDGPFMNMGQYYREESLCRSHAEPVTWKGVTIY